MKLSENLRKSRSSNWSNNNNNRKELTFNSKLINKMFSLENPRQAKNDTKYLKSRGLLGYSNVMGR